MNTFYEFFKNSVEQNPSKIAVRDQEGELDYATALQLSKSLYSALASLDIEARQHVVVFVERSKELVLAFLAVSYGDFVFLPIPISTPMERVSTILDTIGPHVFVTDLKRQETVSKTGIKHVLIENLLENSHSNVEFHDRPSDAPLYTLFTSGSTGVPKGISISTGNLINFINGIKAVNLQDSENCVLARTSIGFDISFLELYVPVLLGATVVICNEQIDTDPDGILELIAKNDIDWMQATPTFWNAVIGEFTQAKVKFRLLISGGEAMGLELGHKLNEIAGEVYNLYGPTEATIWTSAYKIDRTSTAVLLGRPFVNTEYKIRLENGQIVDFGLGELLIGGLNVGVEYINRPDLTKEQFQTIDGQRYFCSRDLVELHRTGELYFKGRIDNQLKINGNRIEPEEIESYIKSILGAQVVVSPVKNNQNLCVFIDDAAISANIEKALDDATWDSVYREGTLKGKLDSFSGWINSFLLKKYTDHEMADWQRNVLKRIHQVAITKSKVKILEIGAGTGMLVTGLLDVCEQYIGIDVSEFSTDFLNEKYRNKENVRFLNTEADEFLESCQEEFDLIIINSVAQYFPDQTYLESTLSKCLHFLLPDGRLFVGDIRNYDLFTQFKKYMFLSKSEETLGFNDFVSTFDDNELLISPNFFDAFIGKQEQHISIAKIGRADTCYTEMSQFRYDCVLWKKTATGSPDRWKIEEIALQDFDTIPSSKLNCIKVVRDYPIPGLRFINESVEKGEFPTYNKLSERWKLSGYPKVKNHTVFPLISSTDSEKIDLVILPDEEKEKRDSIFKNSDDIRLGDRNKWTNSDELKEFRVKELMIRLTNKLSEKVPHYMIPEYYEVVSDLPTSSSGKIKRSGVVFSDNHRSIFQKKQDNFLTIYDFDEENPVYKYLHKIIRKSFNLDELESKEKTLFQLGANSLHVLKIRNKIDQNIQIKIPINQLFHTDLMGITKHIEKILLDQYEEDTH